MIDIKLQNLARSFGSGHNAVRAVDDVSLTIPAGEFFFLLGPSGCGKTTLLRMIAGLIEPTAGRVLFGDRDLTFVPMEQRNVAMVFQNYALWPHMTVQDNVEFGPRMQGKARPVRQEIAAAKLGLVQMAQYGPRKPNQLSGGQQQRVALARALAAQSSCLLLDEPLSNLDARLRQHMRVELRQLVKSTGVTAIYVTHDQAEALSMADRIAVMNAGRVVQVGTPQELYEQPASRFVADFLGEANFITARVKPSGDGRITVQTPAGTLESTRPLPAGAGVSPAVLPSPSAEITCCVRPEKLRLAAQDANATPPATGLSATIVGTTYLGHMQQYACRLTDGTVWRATVMGGVTSLAVGQLVTLMADPQDVVLLAE